MIGKHRRDRRIDRSPHQVAGVSSGGDEGASFTAPPSPPTIPAPTNLQLTTALYYSAVTSGARIDASWTGLETYDQEIFVVEISTSSTFATSLATYTTAPNQTTISISPLPLNTTFYVRVRAVVGTTPSDWSSTANITTPSADTVAPAAPTGQAATFINGGDLVITWTNPTSANFRDVEIKIYASNGGTLLQTVYDATGRYVWTTRENLQATSGAGDPSLYVELRSRNWFTAFSSSVNASATKSAPAQPTVTIAGAVSLMVCRVTSARESVYSLFEYVWKRDGVTVRTQETADLQNEYEASAAADAGNHNWTCTVRQKDAFGQYSSATVSSTVGLDAITIGHIRSGASYSDSVGSTFTPPAGGALGAMKDNDLDSGGISYNA